MVLPATTSSDIQALLDEINAAGSAHLRSAGDLADAGPVAEGPARRRLIAAAQKLVTGLQNPVEAVLEATWQNHRNAVMRTCSELGIFELVPQTGQASLQELAEKTGADRQLLYRLMRALTATGIFTEVEEQVYSHNALSLVCISPFKHILKHIWSEMYDASIKLPEYLHRTAYGTKADPDGFELPIQYSLGVRQNFFEWLKTQPEKLTTFNLAMKSRAAKSLQAMEAYPVDTELGHNPPSTENEVLLVDVGGGHGQHVEAIRAKFPGLKGRMIVQDLKETIDEIQDPKGFEPMVHDFFVPQPVKGARVYFFSWILHDWSDRDCRKILANTVSAMRPGHSRILILDFVLPDTGAPALAALSDINMMLIGGMERSEKQWVGLLEPLGLRIVKIWNKGDANIIEARLKE